MRFLFSGMLFKVHTSDSNTRPLHRKIVPTADKTSLRLLKDCRYLREYKSINDDDKMASEKVTSWASRSTFKPYNDTYIANVRLRLEH